MAKIVESAEDIQKAPKPPKDDRSAADRALTRHVDNFEMPGQAETAGGEPSQELPEDFVLPKTLKAAHALLEKVQADQPLDGKSAAVKQLKIETLMKELAVLGAGPATPAINMAQFKDITGAQSDHANELKLGLLAQSHPEVKALLDERDSLKAKLKSFEK